MGRVSAHADRDKKPVTAYLGLGANMGDRAGNIRAALQALDARPDLDVLTVSSLYETEPVGMTEQPDFLNAAAQVRTTLTPEGLLAAVLTVEQNLGRVRNQRWGPRVIDIDILLYGECHVERPSLTVPHPRLRERAFVLVPLAEIAPDITLPGEKTTVHALAENLSNLALFPRIPHHNPGYISEIIHRLSSS